VTALPAHVIIRELVRGLSDDALLRPLWEFPVTQRKAVLAERARRWGAPESDQDFDHEYH
jgi:hypothetical protein